MKLAVYKFPGGVSFYQMPYKENKEDYRHHMSVLYVTIFLVFSCIFQISIYPVFPSKLVHSWAMSLGRSPFCNWRVSPSSKRLDSQIWCYYAIYHMCGHNNMWYKYYRICFGIATLFVAMLCNRSLGYATDVHEQKRTSHVKWRNDSAHIY